MKRTLAISLLLAVSTGAVGQNPAVIQKNAQAVKGGAQTQSSTSAKPSPVAVKAVPAPAVVVVKPAAAQSKPNLVAVQPVASKATTVPAAKPASAQVVNNGAAKTAVAVPAAKPMAAPAKPAVAAKPVVAGKPATKTETPVKAVPVPVKAGEPKVAAAKAQPSKNMKAEPVVKADVKTVAVKNSKVAGQVKDDTKKPAVKSVGQAGRRDPFVSPIVSVSAVSAGCSSGKRCLAIDQIALKGIVKSDTGMIAVVVNAAAKAYFLRENDPVFNGYVMKITGDSVVFKETFHDKLGKPLTRDVTKTISRPVA
jgi:hypothetical protein